MVTAQGELSPAQRDRKAARQIRNRFARKLKRRLKLSANITPPPTTTPLSTTTRMDGELMLYDHVRIPVDQLILFCIL